MSNFVVLWDNPLTPGDRKEREWFDTEAEARAAIVAWAFEFPWNTYKLAVVADVHEGTGKYPPRYDGINLAILVTGSIMP